MINLNEAWWFYSDFYCGSERFFDRDEERFKKSFYRRVAEEWSWLKPDL